MSSDPLMHDPYLNRRKEADAPSSPFIGGLDLGQMQDYTALAVLSKSESAPDAAGKRLKKYLLGHLVRWPLKTSYTQIVDDVSDLYARESMSGAPLVIDATGVGRAVVDLFRKARSTGRFRAKIEAVTITGGSAQLRDGREWHVPKKELCGVLQVLFGGQRLQIVPTLPLAKVMAKELQTFSVKVNLQTGNESFEAWRERDHDDIVLATALACWFGERKKFTLDMATGGM